MGRKTLLEEGRIEETIRRIPANEFTVLDFIDVFKIVAMSGWAPRRMKM
jgi:hypothetical protein